GPMMHLVNFYIEHGTESRFGEFRQLSEDCNAEAEIVGVQDRHFFGRLIQQSLGIISKPCHAADPGSVERDGCSHDLTHCGGCGKIDDRIDLAVRLAHSGAEASQRSATGEL